MSTFKREIRYVVFKTKDLVNLSPEHQHMLHEVSDAVMALREARGKPDIECVVVENDWPEYGLVWQMIQDRVEERDCPLVARMVDRFLGWKLPKDFNPDCGITFKPESDYQHSEYGRAKYEPTGTNLFTVEQATKLFEYLMYGNGVSDGNQV